MTGPLAVAAAAGGAAAAALLCLALLPGGAALAAIGGERGERRREAFARWPALAWLEPALRSLAEEIGRLVGRPRLARLEARAALAGHPLGLDAAELLALAVAAAAVLAAAGALAARAALGAPAPGAIVGAVVGAVAPLVKLDDAVRARLRAIGRGLPQAIDLIALAMQGGGDLLGALGHVVERLPAADPLRAELRHVLRRLALGHSRASAFAELARRAPTPVVRQFTAAVLQAEKQGTPLAEVLAVQAAVMRLRRSEAAEQAAARAAVLIIGPLMLIFACVFVVLLGPFAIKAIRGELF